MARLSLTTNDGLALVGEQSGSGSAVLFVHANGFCKELWRPVARQVTGIRALMVDQRGHGGSAAGAPPFDWWDLGRDAAAWAATLPAPRYAVGHSSGGAALAMAEILAPGTFRHLVLIEPIVFPGPYGRSEDHHLVRGALRRRPIFESIETARAAYTGRGPFARWTPEALDLYLEHGFVDGPEGRHLACPPEVEAEYYRQATRHAAWERLAEVGCPVTLLVGEHSDSHPPEFATRLAGRFGQARLISYPGASHFLPMEHPDAVAALVGDVVGI